MDDLRQRLPALAGGMLDGRRLALADDFAYTDPVDGSRAEHQGVRIQFDDGSRIVLRLSGTGTEGATLRLYLERFETDPARHDVPSQEALADLAGSARRLAGIEQRLGRTEPSVVT